MSRRPLPPPPPQLPRSNSAQSTGHRSARLPASPIKGAQILGAKAGQGEQALVEYSVIPENTRAIDQSFGYGLPKTSSSMLDTGERRKSPPAATPLPKGPKRFHFPPILLAGLAIALVGLLAWWVAVDQPDVELAPFEPAPRAAALIPPVAEPAPPVVKAPPPVAQPPKAPEPPPKSKPKKPRARPKPPAMVRPPAYVHTLSDKDIRDALRRTRGLIKSRCGAPQRRVSLMAVLVVDPNGSVSRVRISPPHERSALGQCVAKFAKRAQFPERARSGPSQVNAAFHLGGAPTRPR